MRRILYLLLPLLITIVYPPKAQAIIFLPAIILIPVAKILAVIIGGFSIPSLGLGALVSHFFGKSILKTLGIILMLLTISAILLAIFLKVQNPDRPWI